MATVIATDPTADLAILRLPEPVADSALVRGDNPIKPGEAVVVVGFPLQGLLSSQASVSRGSSADWRGRATTRISCK
jgi:S1-C subfamily serine protease